MRLPGDGPPALVHAFASATVGAVVYVVLRLVGRLPWRWRLRSGRPAAQPAHRSVKLRWHRDRQPEGPTRGAADYPAVACHRTSGEPLSSAVSRCEAQWLLQDLKVGHVCMVHGTYHGAKACMLRESALALDPWRPCVTLMVCGVHAQVFMESGDAVAMQRVGQMLAAGYGMKQDAAQAAAWLSEAW